MPRMIDLVRTSSVPATLMQAAAKGALSVPAAETIEILVHLALHNKVFGTQARMTLAGWDEAASRAVAADPNSPKEVLEYLAAPDNIRPVLVSSLLENPSVTEETLIQLAAAGSREVVEAMLKSTRVQQSTAILNALRSNPKATAAESTDISEQMEAPSASPSEQTLLEREAHAEEEPPTETPAEAQSDGDEVLDEGVAAYLQEHAAEILSEGEKPFQPIGGVYEEAVLEAAEPVAPAAASSGTAAAALKAPVHKKSHLSHDEERGSALQKISRLDIKGRIQLAMKGTKEERGLLVRDGTKIVALSVLDSPKIGDAEVERFASQKNVLEAVLRAIPLKRRFAKHYGIIRNLVFNPRTPLDVSLGLMKNILIHDLRNLAGNKEVSETVRKLALKMFKQKMDVTKKSTD